MKVAVVGATGMVGEVMLKVLAERNFPITQLLLVASERSVGKKLNYNGVDYTVIGLADAVALKPDIALFSAGGATSLEWAPKFAEAGSTVVDNSSAWRMDPTKKLVVPEINANAPSSSSWTCCIVVSKLSGTWTRSGRSAMFTRVPSKSRKIANGLPVSSAGGAGMARR